MATATKDINGLRQIRDYPAACNVNLDPSVFNAPGPESNPLCPPRLPVLNKHRQTEEGG